MIDSKIIKTDKIYLPNVSRETLKELDEYSQSILNTNKKIKPKTMGQALRIDGITPAAVYILLSHLKRKSIKHIA